MNNYEKKRQEKKERYEALAAKHESQAESRFDTAHKIGDAIPFGQPILVGHHSEGRHRRDIAKIDTNMRKGIEHKDTQKYYEHKVKTIETSRVISSDDPEAITKLKLKIEKEKLTHKTAKNKRKEFRDRKEELIKELGDREYHSKYYLLEAYMTGATAEIKRCEVRIQTIQAKEAAPEVDETINSVKLEVNKDENRIMIFFESKPDEETRKKLKGHGFRWSGRNMAWQSYIHDRNLEFARELLSSLS